MSETSENELWRNFLIGDHFVSTDSMTMIAKNEALIAIEEWEDAYYAFIRLKDGKWSIEAQDYDTRIEIIVNLHNRFDITANADIEMMFINCEGIVTFTGSDETRNIYQELGFNHHFLKYFSRVKLFDDRLILIGASLIVEYKDGKFKNISNNLFSMCDAINSDKKESFYNQRDVLLVDNSYFALGSYHHYNNNVDVNPQMVFHHRTVDDYEWKKVPLKLAKAKCRLNTAKSLIHEGDFILIYSDFYLAHYNIKTGEISYTEYDELPAEYIVKYNEKTYQSVGDYIFDISTGRNILENFEKRHGEDLRFFTQYEIFEDILYVFGPLASLIAIDKENIEIFPLPEVDMDSDNTSSNDNF